MGNREKHMQSFEREATTNIMVIKDGVLHTPLPDCFLDGITRQTVIALARSRGYEVVERAIMPEELAGTQEVFITGTAVEVTPVSEIDAHRFTPGEITKNLMTDYADLVNGRLSEASAA